jgi:hypothetical protein
MTLFDDFFDDGFWDLDAADFFILAGAYGYGKEECEERARIEKAAQEDQDQPDLCCQDCDPPTPSDEEPYP